MEQRKSLRGKEEMEGTGCREEGEAAEGGGGGQGDEGRRADTGGGGKWSGEDARRSHFADKQDERTGEGGRTTGEQEEVEWRISQEDGQDPNRRLANRQRLTQKMTRPIVFHENKTLLLISSFVIESWIFCPVSRETRRSFSRSQ